MADVLLDGKLTSAMRAIEAAMTRVHPTLHVYRYWRPDMTLPALWKWLTPSDAELVGAPVCKTIDTLNITLTIGVQPQAVAGEGDALELEVYGDLLIDAINAELASRYPFGQREAKRRGVQTVSDRLGDASILCLELPLEVKLHRPVPVPL